MLKRWTVVAAVMAVFGSGSGCGRQAARTASFGLEPAYTTVPAAMGPLIPADAVGLLYFSSIDEAEKSLQLLKSAAGGDSSRVDLVATLATRFKIPEASVDRVRPLAIALSLFSLGAPVPVPTAIVPVHDPEAVLRDLRTRPGSAEPLAHEGYIGIPLLPGYELGSGIPPLARNLPAGSIALRLRVDRILSVVQPFLDVAFERMTAPSTGESDSTDTAWNNRALQAQVAQSMGRQVLDLLRATETVDCGIRTRAENLAVAYRMQTLPESTTVAATARRAAGLVDLSRCLPQEYPVMGLVAMDFSRLADLYADMNSALLQGAMSGVPDSLRASMQSMIEHGTALYRVADDQLFWAMRFTESGLEMIQVLATREPERFIEEIHELLESGLMGASGFGSVEWLTPETFDRVRIEGARVRWNVAKLAALESSPSAGDEKDSEIQNAQELLRAIYGGDGMVVRFAAVGHRVVVVTHPERTAIERCIERLDKGGELPDGLQEVRRRVQDPLCFWSQADLRDMLVPVLEAVCADTSEVESRELLEDLKKLEPMPVTAYATAGHLAYEGTFSLTAATYRELAQLLARHAQHHDPGRRPLGRNLKP